MEPGGKPSGKHGSATNHVTCLLITVSGACWCVRRVCVKSDRATENARTRVCILFMPAGWINGKKKYIKNIRATTNERTDGRADEHTSQREDAGEPTAAGARRVALPPPPVFRWSRTRTSFLYRVYTARYIPYAYCSAVECPDRFECARDEFQLFKVYDSLFFFLHLFFSFSRRTHIRVNTRNRVIPANVL